MRNKYWKMMLIVFLSVSFCLPVSGCTKGTGTLRVGVRSDIRYWGYYNETKGRYFGMEIDLADKLAEKLGYANTEYVTVDPSNRETKLENDEVDCVIACYSVTDERRQIVDFSPVYYTDHVEILAMNSTLFTQASDLVGRTVGYMGSTDALDKLQKEMIGEGLITAEDTKGTVFKAYENYQSMFVDMEIGDVDALVMDGSIADDYVREDSSIITFKKPVTDEEYAVATKKGSTLSDKVSTAMTALLNDGTMDALIAKWQ